MTKTSWVEICVSDFEQSIQWFENILGFRVVARDANEDAEYDDYYEEEGYYPEEEGLDELVGECIEALGNCLAGEQADRVAREKIIEVLFDIYQHDLQTDSSLGFTTSASEQLVEYTTPLERQTIATWIRDVLTDEEEEVSGSQRKAYGKFLLDLEKDTLDD